MAASEWHDWHDFYMLLGTASAALVALLFVAVSIGANFLMPGRSVATRTFMSPVVFHFSTDCSRIPPGVRQAPARARRDQLGLGDSLRLFF